LGEARVGASWACGTLLRFVPPWGRESWCLSSDPHVLGPQMLGLAVPRAGWEKPMAGPLELPLGAADTVGVCLGAGITAGT
jgi:hypothetical protein